MSESETSGCSTRGGRSPQNLTRSARQPRVGTSDIDAFAREVIPRILSPRLMLSIQILSRSYAVRYRECCANETLVWQFKPIKKSINWAIWRKTDTTATSRPSTATPKRQRTRRRRSTVDGEDEERRFNLHEKLLSVGMEEVVPGGRCEGGQIQKGTYNVTKGGMYALVFGIHMYLVYLLM